MNFGSIIINKTNINNNYKIISFDDSPYFPIFIESLQLSFEDAFFANNVSSLSLFIKTNQFSVNTAYLLLSSIFNQLQNT